MTLSKEEWADWREHPATQVFFKKLSEEREEILEYLAAGAFSEQTGRQNILVGCINALTKILNKDFVEAKVDG